MAREWREQGEEAFDGDVLQECQRCQQSWTEFSHTSFRINVGFWCCSSSKLLVLHRSIYSWHDARMHVIVVHSIHTSRLVWLAVAGGQVLVKDTWKDGA